MDEKKKKSTREIEDTKNIIQIQYLQKKIQ